ncbi:MAG TPA: FkbM family methyltransferase [Lysobacter sp.]
MQLNGFGQAFPPVGLMGEELQSLETAAGPLWFPMIDQVMREHIRHSGSWEPDIGKAITRFLPPSGGVFLDIGANVGYFSCLVARQFPGCQVHAFEPHPLTYQILQLNSWQYRRQIQPWPCALGDKLSTVALEVSTNNLGDTRASAPTERQRASIVSTAISLDELMPDLKADVIKIDVQGAELSVLRGLMGVVRNSPGVKVITEFSPGLLEDSYVEPQAILEALRSLGFNIHLLRSGDPAPTTNAEIIEFCRSAGRHGQANLLLSSKLD